MKNRENRSKVVARFSKSLHENDTFREKKLCQGALFPNRRSCPLNLQYPTQIGADIKKIKMKKMS